MLVIRRTVSSRPRKRFAAGVLLCLFGTALRAGGAAPLYPPFVHTRPWSAGMREGAPLPPLISLRPIRLPERVSSPLRSAGFANYKHPSARAGVISAKGSRIKTSNAANLLRAGQRGEKQTGLPRFRGR